MDKYVNNTINVDNDTFRFTSENKRRPWGVSKSYSSQNYFGDKRVSYNICLMPLGAFSFKGKATEMHLRAFVYKPSSQFPKFCWAVCTSDRNKAMYEFAHGDVADNTKIASGTAELVKEGWGWQTFVFHAEDIPADTPLYVYFWPFSTGGVAHIDKDITATLFYEE